MGVGVGSLLCLSMLLRFMLMRIGLVIVFCLLLVIDG